MLKVVTNMLEITKMAKRYIYFFISIVHKISSDFKYVFMNIFILTYISNHYDKKRMDWPYCKTPRRLTVVQYRNIRKSHFVRQS